MKSCRRLLLLAGFLLAQLAYVSIAGADQSDPRLAPLFESLPDAGSPLAAQQIEQQIWTLWFASPGSTAEAELGAARQAAESGDISAAVDKFDRLVEAHPDYAEGWNQRAIMRYLVGDIDGSLADIEHTLELEPRHFGALSGKGQCYLQQERYQEALTAFEDALNINPWIESSARQVEMLKALLATQKQTPI